MTHPGQASGSRVVDPARVTGEKARGEPLHMDFAATGAHGWPWAHAPWSFAEETHLLGRGVSNFLHL